MPITRLPVIHKFGIISHSQRLELQERLLKQTYLQSVKSRKATASARNPLEISEQFVLQYNGTEDFQEKMKMEEVARKMFARSKRRTGVKDQGEGHHVNLPMGWTELAQLAQCKGQIQEDSLDLLIASLDVSPLEKYHIPALFFLAETMLYWLRTEVVHQPYLRTSEIKLLRMGQLVFTRLFYHHMAGQLQGHSDFKNRLFTYLDGLQDSQGSYSPYPNALLSLRFIIEVGKIVLADAIIEPGEVKEGDTVPPRHNMDELNYATREMYDKRSKCDSQSNHSGAISSSVHDLSPTLWHALDVWRCTNHLGGGLSEALKALAHCGLGLANESWVDGMTALFILAEAAKTNMAAMKVLHCLAQGVNPSDRTATSSLRTDSGMSEMLSTSNEIEEKSSSSKNTTTTSKPSLSDIYERSEESYREKKTDKSERTAESRDQSIDQSATQPTKTSMKGSADARLQSREVSFDKAVDRSEQFAEREVQTVSAGSKVARESPWSGQSQNTVPGTGWKAEFGSDLPSRRMSETSSVETFTNLAMPQVAGIHGWHWEVAISYCDILADICIYGSTANIQRVALVGINQDLMEPMRRGFTTVPLPSAGLVDLAFFKPLHEIRDGGANDWSWRIRYGAIQSMVRICRSLADDKNREGLCNTAWNILLKAHSSEKDDRVLEALKVGQVQTDIESFLRDKIHIHPSTIGTRFASGLAATYLPPLPPAVQSTPRKVTPKKKVVFKQDIGARKRTVPARTTLKEEIMLATALTEPLVDFNVRTSYDLRRIVEDQWRKELQEELNEEAAEQVEQLTEEQHAIEQQQRDKAAHKLDKLALVEETESLRSADVLVARMK